MLGNYLRIYKKIIIKKVDYLRYGKMSFYSSKERIHKIKINKKVNRKSNKENIINMIFSIHL